MGSQALCRFATKGAGSLNIKGQASSQGIYSILCMRRCKPVDSLNSLLSYAPQLSGAVLFPCSSCCLHSPSSSAVTVGAGGICWIAVWRAPVHIWRPEIADGGDRSCLLIRQEIFSFHSSHWRILGEWIREMCIQGEGARMNPRES